MHSPYKPYSSSNWPLNRLVEGINFIIKETSVIDQVTSCYTMVGVLEGVSDLEYF
jgi:hypothetical protein